MSVGGQSHVTLTEVLHIKKQLKRKFNREKQKFQPKPECRKSAQRITALSYNWLLCYPYILPWGLGCLIALKGQELLQLWELNREEKDYFHQRHCRSLPFYKTMHHNAGEGNGTPLQCSYLEDPVVGGAWQAAVHGVAKSGTRLSDFTFSFHFHALEKEMATHSSVLAWRIPGTGEPGGLPSMGSHGVRHD